MSAKGSHRRTPAVIGLDLGGTKLASALFAGQRRQIIAGRAVPLEDRAGPDVGRLIASETKRLLSTANRRQMTVIAIGIAVPGTVAPRTGRVWAPNISGWDDYPLKRELRAAAGDRKMKVVVESDRAASILGEVWQGAARGCRDAIFLAVGTGIGAGILANGRVLTGSHGIAGAIGWLALDRPFRPDYTACGCFEGHASGQGIAKVAAALLARRKNYRGPLRAKHPLTSHDVFTAYESGDDIAREVIPLAVEFWGMACANLVSLFNPEKIIFGGGVFGPANQFIGQIADEARRWAQPVAINQVEFEPSQLGADAALYGAAFRAGAPRGLPIV